MNVSKGTHTCSRAEDAFVEAAAKLGYPEAQDLQNLDANNAIERYYRYVGTNGRRQDAAHRYLHPKLQSGDYPNLHVLVEKQVLKVLFDDNKKAVGVEYQTNPKYLANPEYLATAYTAVRSIRSTQDGGIVRWRKCDSGYPRALRRWRSEGLGRSWYPCPGGLCQVSATTTRTITCPCGRIGRT